MFVIIAPYLFHKNFRGMAIFPFVFLRDKSLKNNEKILNHECIHLRQQLELLWILFFICYGLEFVFRWIEYRDRKKAYLNISFEREAYQNEENINYLKSRKIFAFYTYL